MSAAPRFHGGVAAFLADEQGRVVFIRENYGKRRYGFPGGRVESGESLYEALAREVREEVGVDIEAGSLVAADGWGDPDTGLWLVLLFAARITSGVPHLTDSGEIAEVLWVDAHDPPRPLTRMADSFLVPAARGERGLVAWEESLREPSRGAEVAI